MESAIHLDATGFAVMFLVVTVGSAIQGTVGFGANLLAAPVLAVIEPEALPATLMLVVFVLSVPMVLRERHGVDWQAVRWLTIGRVPGVVVGSLVVVAVTVDTLSVLAGVAVLLAVGSSLLSATVPITRATTMAAGMASGAMGTATSIGGPPVALLYQHQEGPRLRATLAAAFACGIVMSFASVAVAGAVAGWQVVLALTLLPGTALGVAISSRLTHRVDGDWLRPIVLALAAVVALVAVVRGLAA
jgi:uncharacterized protein